MSVYVFTGPSISVSEAGQFLDAIYLPPVTQGDVYRVGLKQPKVIGIIDGYFEHVPSVWHKEILWAMTQGIHVYGSASMGALRAAELAMFGMIGVGQIFEAYRAGILEDDDEVAVAHTSAEEGYLALSIAMTDIRQTLQAATEADIIHQATAESLRDIAKNLFYPQRIYPTILRLGIQAGLPEIELAALREWLPHGQIHQKRLDAIAMLEKIRVDLPALEPKQVKYTLEHTDMWDTAMRQAGELQLGKDGQETLLLDTLLDELRLAGKDVYTRAEQGALARFLGLIEARWQGIVVSPSFLEETISLFRRERKLTDETTFKTWLTTNRLTDHHFMRLMEDEARMRLVIKLAQPEIARHLPDYLRTIDQYTHYLNRATEKQVILEANGLQNPSLTEIGISEYQLLHWYFVEQLGLSIVEDLAQYAIRLGFTGEIAFKRALLRNYVYHNHVV